jgi:hypothetical protein
MEQIRLFEFEFAPFVIPSFIVHLERDNKWSKPKPRLFGLMLRKVTKHHIMALAHNVSRCF